MKRELSEIDEFIAKLAVESEYFYADCSSLVEIIIKRGGTIEKAKKMYREHGIYSVILYSSMLKTKYNR